MVGGDNGSGNGSGNGNGGGEEALLKDTIDILYVQKLV